MESQVKGNSGSFIETGLGFVFLLILLFAMLTVLHPFFGVFAYAIIFSVALAKPFESLVRLLKGKRKLAAFIYAVLLLALVAGPFIYLVSVISNYIQQAEQWITDAKTNGVPPLPEGVGEWPLVGKKIAAFWLQMEADPKATIHLYEPQIRATLQHLLHSGAGIIGATLEFVVGIIISAILLTSRKSILPPIYATMARLAGEKNGPSIVDASGRAVKGVAIGVMGTAFIAALAAWIGFTIAGISFAVALAALTFFLVVIQIGPLLVVLPVVIWLASNGETGMAIFVGIYGLVVLMGIDNILKPILIAKSGKLPILVLFLG
ncbi:MAG TPA: AI-2E family transporter, partial [Chitinophagaceae bacterium]|nr:AI-2E family transporter [Chitinophagaceae bacterium]